MKRSPVMVPREVTMASARSQKSDINSALFSAVGECRGGEEVALSVCCGAA